MIIVDGKEIYNYVFGKELDYTSFQFFDERSVLFTRTSYSKYKEDNCLQSIYAETVSEVKEEFADLKETDLIEYHYQVRKELNKRSMELYDTWIDMQKSEEEWFFKNYGFMPFDESLNIGYVNLFDDMHELCTLKVDLDLSKKHHHKGCTPKLLCIKRDGTREIYDVEKKFEMMLDRNIINIEDFVFIGLFYEKDDITLEVVTE